MKLPMRPAPKPIAGSGAAKSNTSAIRLPRRLANIASATSTPTRPPWKDMPPSQIRSTLNGSARMRSVP